MCRETERGEDASEREERRALEDRRGDKIERLLALVEAMVAQAEEGGGVETRSERGKRG